MKYLPLIELSLTHSYYTSGRCPDFQIEPAAPTQRLLRNHRAVFRHREGQTIASELEQAAGRAGSSEVVRELLRILLLATAVAPATRSEDMGDALHRLRKSQDGELSGRGVIEGIGDDVYIENAGLVMVWPFLPHIFARLELSDERNFSDRQAQCRAVALLHALVYDGNGLADELVRQPLEYMLALNKLLCGMGLTADLHLLQPLSARELHECTALIEAAIAHAPILRNTSPAGFRASFLLRPGIVRIRDGAWLLQVEGRSYDLVLAHVPWTWTWVKLPWMETPLRVEW